MDWAAWSEIPSAIRYGGAAWLGACVGSFVNVLIHRLPRDQGVAGGRSRCPACRAQIAWYDNVPVMSWLWLRGRCRHCAAAIGVRYPLIELAGAFCAIVSVYRFGFGVTGAVAGFFLLWLLAIAVIDWEHMLIPHTLTVSGMLVAVATAALTGIGPIRALAGAAVGAGIVLAISYGYQLVRGQPGMGGGDVMLMGMIGAYLGPWLVAAVLFGGALLGTAYVLVRYQGRLGGDAKLPFGTFLAASSAVVLLAGEPIARWYLALFA
jgi:leader peptidase (prepilin peptidase)/N-methyltransferase